jgi:hypothetical protein
MAYFDLFDVEGVGLRQSRHHSSATAKRLIEQSPRLPLRVEYHDMGNTS